MNKEDGCAFAEKLLLVVIGGMIAVVSTMFVGYYYGLV